MELHNQTPICVIILASALSWGVELNTVREMESIQITLRVDAEASEGAFVEPIAPNIYRLEHTPLFANRGDDPIHAGDVIEAKPLPDGTHQLVRVVKRSPMRHFTWAVPRFFVESGEFAEFGAAVVAAGGNWEGAFGGMLWVHLPPDSEFDPEAELARRISAAKSRAHEQPDVEAVGRFKECSLRSLL